MEQAYKVGDFIQAFMVDGFDRNMEQILVVTKVLGLSQYLDKPTIMYECVDNCGNKGTSPLLDTNSVKFKRINNDN